MKKSAVVLVSLMMIFALAACGGTAEESEPVEEMGLNEAYSDALPISSQLALGSLQLETTELAIDEEQAANLLPLWQAFQSLSASDTAAEAELEAVLDQIEKSMSDEQIKAIAAMELTAEDISTLTEELGLRMGRGGFGGQEGEEPGSGGGIFGGGRPGGGEGLPGEGLAGGDADARATRLAEMGGDPEDTRARFMNQAMVGALVRSLQVKTGELDPAEGAAGWNQGRQTFTWALEIVSDSSGIPVETLQAETAEGASLAEVITNQGGDLEAVEAALTEAFNAMPANANMDVEERVSDLLNQSWVAESE